MHLLGDLGDLVQVLVCEDNLRLEEILLFEGLMKQLGLKIGASCGGLHRNGRI